jgi:hypothetical protein
MARAMGLVSRLSSAERALLAQLRDLPSWRERVSMLTFLEAEHAGGRPSAPDESSGYRRTASR